MGFSDNFPCSNGAGLLSIKIDDVAIMVLYNRIGTNSWIQIRFFFEFQLNCMICSIHRSTLQQSNSTGTAFAEQIIFKVSANQNKSKGQQTYEGVDGGTLFSILYFLGHLFSIQYKNILFCKIYFYILFLYNKNLFLIV